MGFSDARAAAALWAVQIPNINEAFRHTKPLPAAPRNSGLIHRQTGCVDAAFDAAKPAAKSNDIDRKHRGKQNVARRVSSIHDMLGRSSREIAV